MRYWVGGYVMRERILVVELLMIWFVWVLGCGVVPGLFLVGIGFLSFWGRIVGWVLFHGNSIRKSWSGDRNKYGYGNESYIPFEDGKKLAEYLGLEEKVNEIYIKIRGKRNYQSLDSLWFLWYGKRNWNYSDYLETISCFALSEFHLLAWMVKIIQISKGEEVWLFFLADKMNLK